MQPKGSIELKHVNLMFVHVRVEMREGGREVWTHSIRFTVRQVSFIIVLQEEAWQATTIRILSPRVKNNWLLSSQGQH